MAMPMVIVGMMVGSIFGLLTAVGAEMVGGQDGIGSRLTYYSSLIEMPQFFACLLILAFLRLMIHIFFSWLSRRLAGWDA
jgi:NitT/TauT family transport system permease protein